MALSDGLEFRFRSRKLNRSSRWRLTTSLVVLEKALVEIWLAWRNCGTLWLLLTGKVAGKWKIHMQLAIGTILEKTMWKLLLWIFTKLYKIEKKYEKIDRKLYCFPWSMLQWQKNFRKFSEFVLYDFPTVLYFWFNFSLRVDQYIIEKYVPVFLKLSRLYNFASSYKKIKISSKASFQSPSFNL